MTESTQPKLPIQEEPKSELLTIIDAEAYWDISPRSCHDIGRTGCHDIQLPIPDQGKPADSNRMIRAYTDPETGLWTVEIDSA